MAAPNRNPRQIRLIRPVRLTITTWRLGLTRSTRHTSMGSIAVPTIIPRVTSLGRLAGIANMTRLGRLTWAAIMTRAPDTDKAG